MRYEDQETSGSTPKLMLFSGLYLSPENPGRMTPPLRSMASVPFQWEEKPGKAIVVSGIKNDEHIVSRSLELPPRLLRIITKTGKSSSDVTKLMPSPDTVLDSACLTNRTSEALSFRLMADTSPDDKDQIGKSLKGSLGRGRTSRRRSLSFSFSNSDCSNSKAETDNIKREGSLVCLSHNHFWEKVFGGLKQLIMPWTRNQCKNGSAVLCDQV